MAKVTSKEYLNTQLSHKPKKLYLKLELLVYNQNTKDFEVEDTQIVEQQLLPNGIEVISGSINTNSEQDITDTLELTIANHTGINNWDSNFNYKDKSDFKWWLDKRLNVYLGLKIDGSHEIEYLRMGHFVITQFDSTHNLTEFPVTTIQGSSKEILFASSRGKFLFPTTLKQHANMVETLITILEEGGEKRERILIDPLINKTHIDIEDGENLFGWDSKKHVYLSLDEKEKAHGLSSLKIEVDYDKYIEIQEEIIATKEFEYPLDVRRINALAVWIRSSTDLPEGAISFLLEDKSGKIIDIPFRGLVGHVIDDGTVLDISNWRNMLLRLEEEIDQMSRVVKLHIRVNRTPFKTPFTLWIDQFYGAELRNMLPYDLNYGAGQNRWNAVKDIAMLLDCRVFYDEFGLFHIEKNRLPLERFESDNALFDHDAYEVLQPVITYKDKQRLNNLYAGTTDGFNEHELKNHTMTIGGSTTSTVSTLAEIVLHEDGLHIREKGKTINTRGKIRAIDQFWVDGATGEKAKPTILNGDTDVEAVWKGHKNEQAVINMYPNGFPHLTEPPIINFTTERIGDMIYHHNNANPDPLIWYTYEAKNRSLRDLRERLAYAEQLELISVPLYTLSADDIIRLEDSLLQVDDNFQIKSINTPLNGDYMSITAVKIKNLIIDVPYFDVSPLKCTACFYGYDACALAFTYPL